MRTLSSLMFAVLATLSVASHAAPTAVPATSANAVIQTSSSPVKVNLNSADAETLKRELSGIGEAKAQAIIAYRDTNGAFTSVDEMLEVNGIGKALLDRNLDKLTIE